MPHHRQAPIPWHKKYLTLKLSKKSKNAVNCPHTHYDMKTKAIFSAIILLVAIASVGLTDDDNAKAKREWRSYLGDDARSHYSALDQINTQNVAQLKVAWQYHSGDSGQVQCNPLVIDGVLFGATASARTFALDAATGKEIWRFEVGEKAWYTTSRGVAYWADGNDKRILTTVGPWLYALDATTGKPIADFGIAGRTSLKAGLGDGAEEKFVISNTPGTIYKNLIIMPLRLSEGSDAAPGYIQAFDVRTGKIAWVFKTIPAPGEVGYETWQKDNHKNTDVGGANNWAGMALDAARGLVFVPTGSAAYDFYGGNRKGDNLFANCLVALDANTGTRRWHYQFVHHDVWDRDLPAAPNLVTLTVDGQKIDAVAQITKQGHIFVFDRQTGKPVFPIEEKPYPQSDIAGEQTAPTQPLPTKPAPFARQLLTEADLNPDAENFPELVARFRKLRSGGQFVPPSRQGSVVFPGFDGGAEWGGAAWDQENGVMYVNANEMPWILTMIDKPKNESLKNLTAGGKLYALNCANCHGRAREGNAASGFPSLVDIKKRRGNLYISLLVKNGKGMMPGFGHLTGEERKSIVNFLTDQEEQKEITSTEPTDKYPDVPYSTTGYNKFTDINGYAAVRPPWGTLNAVNLNTGEYLWKRELGEFKELTAKGIPPTGTENYGGPIVTAGGLLFIAATKDEMFRAFDKKTGKILWQTQLPAGGYATPATYQANGRQYVVVAAGGGKMGTKKGDSYVAFALEK